MQNAKHWVTGRHPLFFVHTGGRGGMGGKPVVGLSWEGLGNYLKTHVEGSRR